MTITDEMIERAAKAAWEAYSGRTRKQQWNDIHMLSRDFWRPIARTALEAAEALSPLTTPPLPEEIAKLIEYLESSTSGPGSPCMKAAAAIRALAQENARLTEIVKVSKERYRQFDAENGELQARIRELEVELAKEKELSSTFNMLAVNHCLDKHKVETERDVIRAKTIEECAQTAITQPFYHDTKEEMRQQWVEDQIVARIRALAQTDESKTESGE